VADLNPTGGSYPHYVVHADGALFFAADDGTTGTQLWTVRGCGSTAEPCEIVQLPLPDQPPSPYGVPYLVKDLNPGPGNGDPYYMTDVGGTAFFQAFRPDTGIELWASDGTEAGTRLVRDLNPGPADSSPYAFTDLGGTAFFVASTAQGGSALWKSDGTEAGTEIVQAFADAWQSSSPRDLTVAGGRLWFLAPSDDGSEQIWSAGDSAGGAQVLPTMFPGWPPYNAGDLAAVGDTLFFTVYDFEIGKQALWKTDGTLEGTSRVRGFKGFATPRFAAAGSLLYFRANNDELWRTDGTVAGTLMLGSGNPDDLTAVGSLLYFTASDPDHGRELWRSDGTLLGTWLVKDIDPGPADGMGGRLTNVDGTLFFWATDGVTGFELWKSDGTPDGTVLVRDIDPTDVTVPSYFQAVGPLLYFTAQTPSFGYELWRSDGTMEGTELVRNINLTRSSYPESPANVGGTLFFNADDGRVGEELWAVPAPTANTTTSTTTTTSTSGTTTTTGLPAVTTTTSTSVSTSAPASTTTTPSSTTSTTTVVPEICGNCIDDDHDGLTDLEDPACCSSAGTMHIEHIRIVPRRGRSGLTLKGGLHGMDMGGLRAGGRDVVLELRAADGPAFCARIPAASLVADKRGLRFNDPRQSTTSAGGVTLLRLDAARNGTVSLSAQGPATRFLAPGGGPLAIRVGFVSPGVGDPGSTCAAATVVLRRGKRGLR
jgi:ELWxxDGT repeat protein